ncbi:hypothetical protein EDB83DRAFT_1303678 [Lactarius deliciosus]|nr:hypothetical protein EDB83DRAFT_1303678 [Lactarius deliciosus]
MTACVHITSTGAVPTGEYGIRTISASPLYHHPALSRLSPKPFSLSKMIPTSHLATCYYRYLIPARRIGTHRDVTLSAIPTSLAALKEVGVLAAKLSYIAPIAGLLLQALTMRDEVKRYKIECKSVMRKLSRVASIIVNVSKMYGKHNLNEEDLPPSLFAILGSLQMLNWHWTLDSHGLRRGERPLPT